jgi:phosphoribosylanthranilate isomerase
MTQLRTLVKICGLSSPETLRATIAAGADMAGFVFFEKSPRHIDLETARTLGLMAQDRISKVALTVDARDAGLDEIVEALAPDMLQLHGKESPERVAAVKARFGLPVIKAIGVATPEDVARAGAFRDVADVLLFDAKPAPDAAVPGGAGVSFDWNLLRNIGAANWMLSGGLDAENVAGALRVTKAPAVDVSSGVERERGVKDPVRIADFIKAVRAL